MPAECSSAEEALEALAQGETEVVMGTEDWDAVEMDGDELESVCAAIGRAAPLRFLSLHREDGLGEEGAAQLGRAVGDNCRGETALLSLYCAHNALDGAAAVALLGALPLRGLVRLQLDFNCIGDDGAKALAKALKEDKGAVETPLEVSLFRNAVTGDGGRALADGVEANERITALHLDANHYILSESHDRIAAVLRRNRERLGL